MNHQLNNYVVERGRLASSGIPHIDADFGTKLKIKSRIHARGYTDGDGKGNITGGMPALPNFLAWQRPNKYQMTGGIVMTEGIVSSLEIESIGGKRANFDVNCVL